MKKLVTTLLTILLMAPIVWSQNSVGPYKVIDAIRRDKSKSLRKMARTVRRTRRRGLDYEIPNKPSLYREIDRNVSHGVDAALQNQDAVYPAGPTIQNWEGLGLGSGGGGTPPDPNMDVGPNHVVQWVNVSFKIWDKSGNPIMGPTPGNAFWSGFGGNCEFTNRGDPIILYDELADRWLASQFTNPASASATQCVAISTTPDPTGSYFRYEFPSPGNDYPKLAVWDDAYFATIRNFSGGFNFDIYAYERLKMLVGAPAQVLGFNMSTILPGSNNFLAADVDGTTPPPAGSPGYVLGITNPSVPQTSLALVEMDINWGGISTMNGPITIPVTPFDGNVCNFARSCIPQPGTNNKVDGFADAMMHRLAYRNFGTHQAMVANHTVDVGDFSDHAGIRWYEFRNTGGGWSTFQDGTYSPDADYRWMPSIAMDKNGNIGLGYCVSSKVTSPSIRYTGRLATDPLGQMTFSEGTIGNGGGSQQASQRWGDYSSMSVDPSDELTFWHTNEYYQTNGNAWKTRVGSFKASELDVTLTCIPDNPPVIIPTSGGSYGYELKVTNNSTATKTLQVWTYAQRNGGGETDALFGPQSVTLGPGQNQVFNNTQIVPPVDANIYTYNCKAGTFPSTIITSDAYTLTISGVAPSNRSTAKSGLHKDWASALAAQTSAVALVPESMTLEANYPNPFNPTTKIRYTLKEASKVRLSIYNTLGQEVKTLVDAFQPAGPQFASWDATNNIGQVVSAGVYLYRLEVGGIITTRKMTLLK